MEVHRVRFFPFTPSAIQCIAFEEGSSPLRLALGRENGSIEVWQKESCWTQFLVLHASKDECAEAILWHNGCLLSAGLSGVLVQWNLSRLCPEEEVNTYGGAVWDMAQHPTSDQVAVACEDGCVRFFTFESGSAVFRKSYSNQGGGRCLSVAFHPEGDHMLSGGADSIIRIWNLATGMTTHRITLGQPRKSAVLVWTLAFLRDMTVVSGDSDGRVQFFDGKHGTLSQSFQTHQADVLSLVASKGQDVVFAAGVDSKVVKFHCIESEEGRGKWINTGFIRQHSHDVRSLALHEEDGSSILVSGGLDTQLGVYAAGNFLNKTARLYSPFPVSSPVSVCRREPIVTCHFDTHIDMWHLGAARAGTDVSAAPSGSVLPSLRQPVHLLRIKAKNQNQIACSAVSPCARWIAVSDRAGTRLFHVKASLDGKKPNVSIKPAATDLNRAQQLAFAPDSSRLLVASNRGLQVAVLDESEVSSREHIQAEGEDFACIRLAVGQSSQYAAVAYADCHVDIVDLKKGKLKRSTPRLPSPCSALLIRSSSQEIVILTRSYQLFVFGFTSNSLSEVSGHLKPISQGRRNLGPVFDSVELEDGRILFCSQFFMASLDLKKHPNQPRVSKVKSKKRKATASASRNGANAAEEKEKEEAVVVEEEEEEEEAEEVEMDTEDKTVADKSLNVITQYSDILALGRSQESSLVVVERPWKEATQKFRHALHRVRYGAT